MLIPFLYQLQDADHASLTVAEFRVAVVDPDDSGLTAAQLRDLRQGQGKLLYAYASIGEAEEYRDYWRPGWDGAPPSFLLAENPEWEGNHRVAFWDPVWQDIIFHRIDQAVATGYDGVYLDIVDGYAAPEVIAAWPGTPEALRHEMIAFVAAISARAKAADPDFAVIPQNAVGLLSVLESDPASGPNRAYLKAIDGLGVEDLWYDDDRPATWTEGDLDMIALAQQAGKFVLATSYPTRDAGQRDFIAKAVQAGLIPFVAERDLTGRVDLDNLAIEGAMAARPMISPWPGGGR